MYKKIPKIASSAVVLTACSGGMGLLTKMQNKDIVEYCDAQVECYGGLYAQYYELYCVDDLMDMRRTAEAFGCETEFDAWLFCEGIQAGIGPECPFEYDEYDDWHEARYGEDDTGDYEPTEDPCEDERDDHSECRKEFLYGDQSDDDTGENGGGWDTSDTAW